MLYGKNILSNKIIKKDNFFNNGFNLVLKHPE